MQRILIADDEPMVIRIYRLGLEAEGYEVEAMPNGAAALKSILANPPAALITDIEMPVMTGQELCLSLEKQLPTRTFPIIVQTSLTADQHRSWSAGIGDLLFMEKPISLRKLIGSLEELLDTDSGARGHAGV